MDDDLKGMLTQLLTVVETTRAEMAELRADQGQQLARLQSDVTEIKHVAGTNYLRIGGRIDQVASQFMEHMADYHGPADRRRA
jgi:hypothetical protein